MSSNAAYIPISSTEDAPDLHDSSFFDEPSQSPKGSGWRNTSLRRPWLLHIVCYCVLISSNAWLLAQSRKDATQNKCLKEVNNYSPILEQIDIELEDRRMNGTLLDLEGMGAGSFLKPPSPAVDAAWEALTAKEYLHIRASDIERMGKDPSVSVRLPESWNYGSDSYIAELDVFHKLHCLNLLRKDIHFDYYYGDRYPGMGFDGAPEFHRMHTNHCLYMLLQTLACDASTDVVPYMWVNSREEPYPDFSINRKCGNLDVLVDWRHRYRVATEKFDALRKPEGQERVVELRPGANGVLCIAPKNA